MSELLSSGGSEGYGACDDEVNVGDNRKITNVRLVGHSIKPPWENPPGAPSKMGRAEWRVLNHSRGPEKPQSGFLGRGGAVK